MADLTPEEVRQYLADSVENNHLLDAEEFTDTRINLAIKLAVDSFNTIPPLTSTEFADIRSNSVILYGTLMHLFIGQTALSARNQMSYSDGGLTVPIEERYQFYVQMSQLYESMFKTAAKDLKVSMNLESAWSEVRTDYATFPTW